VQLLADFLCGHDRLQKEGGPPISWIDAGVLVLAVVV
jgi:hypothetical protein